MAYKRRHAIYSLLLLTFGTFAIAIISQALDIGEYSVCPNGSMPYTYNNKWQCGTLDPSQFNVNYSINNYNYTVFQINESDPIFNNWLNNTRKITGNFTVIGNISASASRFNITYWGVACQYYNGSALLMENPCTR